MEGEEEAPRFRGFRGLGWFRGFKGFRGLVPFGMLIRRRGAQPFSFCVIWGFSLFG